MTPGTLRRKTHLCSQAHGVTSWQLACRHHRLLPTAAAVPTHPAPTRLGRSGRPRCSLLRRSPLPPNNPRPCRSPPRDGSRDHSVVLRRPGCPSRSAPLPTHGNPAWGAEFAASERDAATGGGVLPPVQPSLGPAGRCSDVQPGRALRHPSVALGSARSAHARRQARASRPHGDVAAAHEAPGQGSILRRMWTMSRRRKGAPAGPLTNSRMVMSSWLQLPSACPLGFMQWERLCSWTVHRCW